MVTRKAIKIGGARSIAYGEVKAETYGEQG
jgi:hypothetical protein